MGVTQQTEMEQVARVSMEISSKTKEFGFLTPTEECFRWQTQALTQTDLNSSSTMAQHLTLTESIHAMDVSFTVWIFAQRPRLTPQLQETFQLHQSRLLIAVN